MYSSNWLCLYFLGNIHCNLLMVRISDSRFCTMQGHDGGQDQDLRVYYDSFLATKLLLRLRLQYCKL